jgi:glycopeptide antibiotics resistance protein
VTTPRSFWIAAAVGGALVLGMTLTPDAPWLFRLMADGLEHPGPTVLARVLNVLLFVPLGAVIGTRLRPRWLWLLVALSVTVETTQFLLADRNPDVMDVVTNTLGGVLGYVAGRWWTHRRERATDVEPPRRAARDRRDA